MQYSHLLVFAASLLSLISSSIAAATYKNDVTLVLAKQNNKFSDLLKKPVEIELNLPEEDELLKVVVKNDIAYDFNSLILSVNGVEQTYPLKINDKKVVNVDASASNDEFPQYTWSIQANQLPRTLLYYAIHDDLPIQADLILKSDEGLVKRTKIFEIVLTKNEDITLDFKKLNNINKGIDSDFKAKKIIRHVFNAPSKQAPEELAIIFSFFICLGAFIAMMLQLKSIAEADKKVVTLKKNCGTLSYISIFLAGILATEYTFLQYYLNNLSIFGLLKYAFFSIIPTILAGVKLSKRLF